MQSKVIFGCLIVEHVGLVPVPGLRLRRRMSPLYAALWLQVTGTGAMEGPLGARIKAVRGFECSDIR